MEITASTYFYTMVFLTWNIWYVVGQDSHPNVNNTTLAASAKPALNYSYQIEGFNSSFVTSGPILIIDKKIIYVTDLNYNGSYNRTHFWAGTGLPSPNGTLIPDENGSEAALNGYIGRNIYLKLPGNLTTDQIDYLGLWSTENDTDLGYVMLYPNASEEYRWNIPEALGHHLMTPDNKTIYRIPKCCQPAESLQEISQCVPDASSRKIQLEKIYPSNETHIDPDDNVIKKSEIVPYIRNLACPPGEEIYRINVSDESTVIGLIFNSSLIFADSVEQNLLSHGKFCMDHSYDDAFDLVYIQLCYKPVASAKMPQLYFPLLIISMICFFLTALCYVIILTPSDVHKQCFIGYCGSMTITFLCLVLLQKVNTACNFIGGLFFLFIFSSNVWFTCLCIDLVFVIRSFKTSPDPTRIYYYLGVSLVIPLIFLTSSLIPDGVPDVPVTFEKMYNNEDLCHFKDTNLRLFFIPIGLLIVISLAALIYSSYIINANKSTDCDWVVKKDNFKFMLRSCALIWTTITVVWLFDWLINEFHLGNMMFFTVDLIESAQGIFILLVFVLNKYSRKEILHELKKDKIKRKRRDQYDTLLKTLDTVNNDGVTDNGESKPLNVDRDESELGENSRRDRS